MKKYSLEECISEDIGKSGTHKRLIFEEKVKQKINKKYENN